MKNKSVKTMVASVLAVGLMMGIPASAFAVSPGVCLFPLPSRWIPAKTAPRSWTGWASRSPAFRQSGPLQNQHPV